MKNIMVLLCLSISLIASAAHAEEIKSVTQTSEFELSITVNTFYYCNSPRVSLVYQMSGRAKFGPHYYDLDIVPVNKMNCSGSKDITVKVSLPANLRAGDRLVIFSNDSSSIATDLK